MAYIRYNIYLWTPPVLSVTEEAEVGRLIMTTGGPAKWKEKQPYLSHERIIHQKYLSWPEMKMSEKLKYIVTVSILSIGCLTALAAVGPVVWVPALIAMVVIAPLSLGSLWYSRRRYRRWIDEMVNAYASNVENELKNSGISLIE